MAAEAIGLTASLIAISELCVKSIALYRTVKDATKDRARLAAEIQFCKALIDELQNASADDVWKATMEVLASPSKGFRHGLNVLKWPFEEKEIKKILDMIERQKASLSLALDNNSRILQDRVASEVGNNTESLKELKGLCGTLCQEIDVVKRSIQQGEDREALHWITRFNFGPRHESILQSWDRDTGTGTWILRHPKFNNWLKSPSSTLWCHGLPGAGKSVIAAIVFDYLNNTFFSIKPEHERGSLELRQLHRDTRRGFSPSLEKLRSAVRLTSAMSRTLFVVLDALDEANEKVQDLIVDRISNLPFQDVRLFCTSRSLPKFKHMFATTDEIEIAAFDDISIFVRKQVSLQSRLRTIIGTDSGLEKSIVDKVTKEANGSFLMASRYMSSLSQADSKGYLLLTTDYLHLPVNDAYDLTMKRIREPPEADRKRAEQTLSLIFGSTRFYNSTPRLAMKEVQHALATLSYSEYGYDVKSDDLPDIDLIVQCCQGLLVLDGDSVLRPSHDTIDQYLRRDQVLETYLPNALEVLSAACCYYLSQDSLHLAIPATISTAPRGRQERKGDYWKRIDDYHDYQERSEKVFDEFPFLKHASAHFHIYLWKAYGKRFPAILAEKRFGECQEEFCEEDTDLIEQLLGRKYATDVNQTDELGRNAVSYATMSSHPCQSVVCKLIEHHADVTKRDVDGMTPILYTAANAEYHSMLWDMIWAYKNANSMDDSNSYTTLCYFAELTLSSDPDVPEPTQKVVSARIDFCSIVLRRIIKYWPIKDLDRILLTFWRFLEKADLDFQSANRRTLRAAMEDAELADIHIMSKVLYFCRQSADEIDLSPPEQWQAVNQQQVEAQTGIDEVRGKNIKGVLSECLTSKMKELCGKRERQISEASRPSIP
ncbi:hypothetical protein K456DRAFT_1719773 [Colletotrichum gloeosporioides 23]|nr:hypothetical protein K456DRAFT_1719773 [Colletotrichum gloeosporioides 23]